MSRLDESFVWERHQGPWLYSALGLDVSASTTWVSKSRASGYHDQGSGVASGEQENKILWAVEMLSAKAGDQAWWQTWQVHLVTSGPDTTHHTPSWPGPGDREQLIGTIIVTQSLGKNVLLTLNSEHWPGPPLYDWLARAAICDDNLIWNVKYFNNR